MPGQVDFISTNGRDNQIRFIQSAWRQGFGFGTRERYGLVSFICNLKGLVVNSTYYGFIFLDDRSKRIGQIKLCFCFNLIFFRKFINISNCCKLFNGLFVGGQCNSTENSCLCGSIISGYQ